MKYGFEVLLDILGIVQSRLGKFVQLGYSFGLLPVTAGGSIGPPLASLLYCRKGALTAQDVVGRTTEEQATCRWSEMSM